MTKNLRIPNPSGFLPHAQTCGPLAALSVVELPPLTIVVCDERKEDCRGY